MASLSNINGLFDVHSTGAILFSTSHGTSGQILRSNGNAAPTWVAASTVIGGPYLPLTGGTLSGATATASGISFTVGGALTGTSATFTGDVTSQGYTIDAAGLQTFQDFQSKPIDTNSGLFTVGGNGMQLGYTRAISMWSSTDGVWNSWVGTNLRWDGTNFKRASDNGSANWGNIAGIRFLGNASTSGAAMQFIIDPPEQSSAPTGEQTIGTTLPASMTALSINNDLSATFAGDVLIRGTYNPYASANRANIALNGSAGNIISFTNNTAGKGYIYHDNTDLKILNAIAGNLIFYTNSTERMRINSSGNVGIGTTAVTEPGFWYDATNKYLAISHWATPPTPAALLHLSDTNNDIDVPQIRIEGRENPGDTKLDISVKDPDVRFYLQENTGDANAGYGLMIFKTNAVANASFPARGGFNFQTPAATSSLFITNEANVGIGTSSPNYKLQVAGTTLISGGLKVIGPASYNTIKSANEYTLGFNDSNDVNQWWIKTYTNGAFALHENGVGDKFSILAGGNVGIGTTNPGAKLEVNGDILLTYLKATGNSVIGGTSINSSRLSIQDSKNGTASSPHLQILGNGYSAYHSADTTAYNIVTNSTGREIRMSANTGGVKLTVNATAWVSNSDIALKENIKPLENVLDKIKDYRCVEYNLKESPEDKKIGFIAQDWVDDFPAIVNKDEKDMLGMKYTETIPVLLKAIQELTARIKELENK